VVPRVLHSNVTKIQLYWYVLDSTSSTPGLWEDISPGIWGS